MSSYAKNIVRTIKESFARFMAILAIIALGVGFYSGLSLTTPSFIKTGNKFINDYKLYDFRLISTIGFTDEDIEELSSIEGLSVVRGAVFADAVTIQEGSDENPVVRFHTLTDGVNELKLIDGRLPQAPNEIVVDEYRCSSALIGTALSLSPANSEDSLERFNYDEYTIVGTVRSPYYLNFQRGTTDVGGGSLSYYAYVPLDGLDHEYYTEAYVYIGSGLKIYSDEYEDLIDSIEDRLGDRLLEIERTRLANTISDARDDFADAMEEFDDARREAIEDIEDGREELTDAASELADAAAELSDAETELADAEDEISDGWASVADGQRELDDSIRTVNENEAALNDAESQINDGLAQANAAREDLASRLSEVDSTLEGLRSSLEQVEGGLLLASQAASMGQEVDTGELEANRELLLAGIAEAESGRSQILEGLAQTDAAIDELNSRMAEVAAGRAQIAEARARIESGQAELDDARYELYSGQSEYEDGLAEYEDGLAEYEDGLAEYEDGVREYRSGLTDFSDAMTQAAMQLYEGRKLIDRAENTEVDTYVLTRQTNVGYMAFDSDAKIVAGISNVFPIFFFAIAALVCSTTMQRMVTDERTQIGTMRALGYSETAITMKYVIYSGLATTIGSIGGYLGGIKLFPGVIWQVYGMMYGFAPVEYETNVITLLMSWAVSMICSVGVTIVTCRRELTGMPAELIRPKAPVAGKKILLEKMTFIWNRLKFTSKVSIRNIFRFKKRMFMMMIGIAGCTALLKAGFGINDSVNNIVDYQYDNIETFDIQMTFKDDVTEEQMADVLASASEASGVSAEGVYVRCSTVTHNGADMVRDMYLFATNDPDISKVLKAFSDGEELPWPSQGTIAISSKLADKNNLRAGDRITLSYGDEGRTFTLTVAYVFDNYIFHMAYMDASTYEQVFGETYAPDTLLVTGIENDADVYSLASKMASYDGVKAWSVTNESRASFRETMQQMNKVVVLIIGCAAALAFIVLFNLNNINITERVREIATIKVLGFSRGETGSYFFRENFLLVFMGFVPGVPLGIVFHRFIISQIAMDTVTFVVRILPQSYMYSLFFVILFSVIVDLVMRIKINKIDMAESLKSAE